MKKAKYIGLVLLLATTMCGCKSTTKEMSLYNRGLETVERLEEMIKSDAYRELFTMESFEDKISDLRSADYSTPKAVYKITVPNDLADSLVMDGVDVADLHNMSEGLKEILNRKIFQSITVRLNSSYGAEAVAVSSLYTDNRSFVSKGAKENVIYMYVYEDAYPVFVDFLTGEDDTVIVNAHFLMTKEIGDSEKEVEELFNDTGFLDEFKVEKVDK